MRQNMGKIIAEDSEDEEDMSVRSSTITMDMLEKAEDQFWEESIDTGEGSYDDFDSDGSDVEKEDDDDGLGEGTVLLRRKRRKNNSNSKTKEESRATRTLENSILRARQFASTENARKKRANDFFRQVRGDLSIPVIFLAGQAGKRIPSLNGKKAIVLY